MSTEPIRIPLRQRLEDLRRGPLVLAVWLVGAAIVATVLSVRSRRYEHVGMARGVEYEVSSTSTGRLAGLAVELFQAVDAGQVLAVLDDTEVKARLATAQADLGRLAASVASNLRSTQVDEERLRIQTLSVRVQIESDRVEKARLDLEVERQTKLAQDGIVPQSVLDVARFTRDTIARRIDENEALLLQTSQEHRKANQSREDLSARLAPMAPTDPQDPRLAPLQEAVRVQERRIEEIEVERRGLVLKSPVEGRVSDVLARNGETVTSGKPILVVSQRVATEVVAFLDPSEARTTRVGEPVRVMTESAIADSFVDRVGPTVRALPSRLWRNPAVAEYGVPVMISGLSGLGLVPGERVSLRFLPGRSETSARGHSVDE